MQHMRFAGCMYHLRLFQIVKFERQDKIKRGERGGEKRKEKTSKTHRNSNNDIIGIIRKISTR